MKLKIFAPAIFAAGVLVGIAGVEGTLHAASAFAHDTSMSGPMSGSINMKMMGKSVGDREMMGTMQSMQAAMASLHLGGDQDHDFMLMMIQHHKSAITMGKVELARGKKPELKALAQDIISSQSDEIVKMQGWLTSWYGSTK